MPFSLLYFFIITLKRIFSVKETYSFFLISVGNITAGGTGKTLFVTEIIKKLTSEGYRIAVVSSIYKKKRENVPGDEVMMIENNFPEIIISGEKNPAGLRKLEKKGVDVVIIDDGFHCSWAEKDIDILMIDSSNPFDNGLLLPAGLLREPVSAIKRADLFVLSYSHIITEQTKEKLFRFLEKTGKPVFFMKTVPLGLYNNRNISYEEIKKKRVLSFAGIGNPFNFFSLISKFQPEKQFSVVFPDHYNYREKDMDEIFNLFYRENIDFIITTEKDYVKVKKYNKNKNVPLYYLKVRGKIEGAVNFDTFLLNRVKLKVKGNGEK